MTELHPILKRRVRDRINRGIKFLNENYPEWLDTIDTDILDLSNSEVCILGQTNGGWEAIIADNCLSDSWLETHGFMLNFSDATNFIPPDPSDLRLNIRYQDLTKEWSNKIEALLRKKYGNGK